MIIEWALITVTPGREAEFEQVLPEALAVLGGSRGCLAREVRRSVETPNRYALRVEWATLEDHTVGFRESAAFGQWRAFIAPFFASPPVVEHFAALAADR